MTTRTNAEKTNAKGFIASIIEQANDLHERLDDVPADLWAEMFSIIRKADDLMDDARGLLDADVAR